MPDADRIDELVGLLDPEGENAPLRAWADATKGAERWGAAEAQVLRALEMFPEAVNVAVMGLDVRYADGDGNEKPLDPRRVTLYYPKGRAPASEREKRLEAALRAIVEHEEHFGSGPPDDEMRETAKRALASVDDDRIREDERVQEARFREHG